MADDDLPPLPPLPPGHGERPELGQGRVWLGDLAGFEIVPVSEFDAELWHRCGWNTVLPTEGIMGGVGGAYLGNTAITALQHLAGDGCRTWKDQANIPVRRRVDGRWQTVMITRAEWDTKEGADRAPAVHVNRCSGDDCAHHDEDRS